MVEVVLTADDLRLADEMNHLYGAKAKEELSDNEVEFLRLFMVKNRSEACVRKLKLLIKLYRQEKRFLAAKGKTENMLKRERDIKQKELDKLAFVLGHAVIDTIEDEANRSREDKRFNSLRSILIKMCSFGLIDERDWLLVQDFVFTSEKNAKSWLELLTKSLDPKNEEFIQIDRFIKHYLKRLNR